jgi:hypothetical protein
LRSLTLPFFVNPGATKVDNFSVYTAAHHGRSVFLSEIDDGGKKLQLFAKGCGWTNGVLPGWSSELGNLGLFNGKTALREVRIAQQLHGLGLRVIEPIAVWNYDWIPEAGTGRKISPTEILDLRGSPSEPALFIYAAQQRYRVCEVAMLSEEHRKGVMVELLASMKVESPEEFVLSFAKSLGTSVGLLHAAGGHNYAASPHNIFLDGTLLDFEYLFLPGNHTDDSNINERPSAWMDKEILGWWETLKVLSNSVHGDISFFTILDTFFFEYEIAGGKSDADMFRHYLRRKHAV